MAETRLAGINRQGACVRVFALITGISLLLSPLEAEPNGVALFEKNLKNLPKTYVSSPARTQWAAFTGDVLTFHGKGESPGWA